MIGYLGIERERERTIERMRERERSLFSGLLLGRQLGICADKSRTLSF